MREGICTISGIIGSIITTLFGGWDTGLITLAFFMAIDYFSGLMVAGVFHNSNKTDSGALESRAGWKGLCRKCMTLFLVLIACRLDIVIGVDYFRDMVVIGFIINETISIAENAGLMGVDFPEPLAKAIDVLTVKNKQEVKDVQADEKKFTK
ncbi:MAG: holin family protein [Emergencia sp.]